MLATEPNPFDFSKLNDLEKKKQTTNEQLDTILDQNNLVRKKIPDGPNSLLRAISNSIYFTSQYADEIQQRIFNHLTNLITTEKLPTRLNMFRGNSLLLKDYTANPQLTGFDKINLELVSSLFKSKVVVYSVSEDSYLSSIIINNGYERAIEVVRNPGNTYEPVFSKIHMLRIGAAQNIVLNIVENSLEGKTSRQFKDINEDSYINHQYLEWLAANRQDNGLSQFRITRGKHKKSFSDSFSKPLEGGNDQAMKMYNMFTHAKPPEDFLNKLLKLRKDTADNIIANLDFMDEPMHETPKKQPKNPAKDHPFATAGNSSATRSSETGFSQPFRPKPINANPAFLHENEQNNEGDRAPITDPSNLSPVHFTRTAPPGLTPSRYPQKSYNYGEASSPDVVAQSPSTFQRNDGSQSAAPMFGMSSPMRAGYSPYNPNYQSSSPLPQYNNLYSKRTGNSESLLLAMQPHEIAMAQQSSMSATLNSGAMSATKEKKKPIILDESLEKYTGRLKFFDEAKNYGFIIMDGDGSDIFVHMDDLMKANITKDMLKMTKNGYMLRLGFSCMKYIGKYQKSRKATDIELLPQ